MKALHHFRNLIADKEDTEQVFHIIEALRDNRFAKSAANSFASADRKVHARKERISAAYCSTTMIGCANCRWAQSPMPIATSWKKRD
jgi:hypothetical protein